MPCLGCGRPTQRTRCATCARGRDRARGTPAQRGYGAQYRKARQLVLQGATACYVQGCTETPTTADHVVPLRQGGGSDATNLRPACRTHNYGWNRRT